MSKRPASYDIDEHTYEEKQKAKQVGDSLEDDGKHIANRKIYKIRKDEQPAASSSGTVSLKLKDNDDVKLTTTEVKLPENPFKLNLFNQSNGVGLFSNTTTTQPPATTPSLFAPKDNNQKPTLSNGSLFGNKPPTTTSGGLFSNVSASSLFGNVSNSNSLFGSNNGSGVLFKDTAMNFQASKPLFGGGQLAGPISAPPEEDQGDSEQLEKAQEMVVDPSKSTVKYDYGGQDDIVKKIAANKFKKDKGNLVESVEVIIKNEADKKLHYLIVRLAATKNIIFTGVLIPHKSAVKRNDENLDILAFAMNEKKELESHRIKLQIKGLDNELGEFHQQLQKIIEGKTQEKRSE